MRHITHGHFRLYGLVAGLVTVATLVGCSATGTPDSSASPSAATTSTSPTATAGGPAQTTTARPPTGGSVKMVQVVMTKTGGITGINQRLLIQPDATWIFIDGKAGTSQPGADEHVGDRVAVADRQRLVTVALVQQAQRRRLPRPGAQHPSRVTAEPARPARCRPTCGRPVTWAAGVVIGRGDQEVPVDWDPDPDGLAGAGGGSAAQVALTRPDPDGSAPVVR